MFASPARSLLLLCLIPACGAPPPEPPPEPLLTLAPQEPDVCLGEPPCVLPREVYVDQAAAELAGAPSVRLVYDLDEVLRPITAGELPVEHELSIAVRLLVSEIGADRMVESRQALFEAVGILETVHNRMDRSIVNPDGEPTAPDFPGCGPGGTFGTCANPGEYLGMATWRALTPDLHYGEDLLEAAADLAVAAWYLHDRDLLRVSDGATSYVHRCGGSAYGMPTYRCDGHLGRPRMDIPGAEPHTGPILFKAPMRWLARKGWYALEQVAWVDYDPYPVVEEEPAVADAEPLAEDTGLVDGAWAFRAGMPAADLLAWEP